MDKLLKTVESEELFRGFVSRPVPKEYIPLIEGIHIEGVTFPRMKSLIEEIVKPHLGQAQLLIRNMTEKGLHLQNLLRAKQIIDIGCGDPRSTQIALDLAKFSLASRYIGIDRYSLADLVGQESSNERPYQYTDTIAPHAMTQQENVTCLWIQDDALGFLAKIKPQQNSAYFISGFDVPKDEIGQVYAKAMLKELERITTPGDVIIEGPATSGIDFAGSFKGIFESKLSFANDKLFCTVWMKK